MPERPPRRTTVRPSASATSPPRVSVIILTYNFERYVSEALESIANQTFQNFEIIVADDDSTDGTREIVHDAASVLPIRVVTGPNIGIGGNWARAMPECKGSLIALVSGDDRLLPTHLEAAVEALDANPSAALAYSYARAIDESGVPIEIPPTHKSRPVRTGRVDHVELMSWNYVGGTGAVMRRDAIDAVGGIDPSLVFVDLDIFVRLAEKYDIVFVPGETVQYRVRPRGMHFDYDANLAWRLAMYDKHLGREPSDLKRALVAKAHFKTAYKQLWPDPTRDSTRRARANLREGLRHSGRRGLRPMTLAMFGAAATGPVWAGVVRRWGGPLAQSRLKPVLERVVGLASNTADGRSGK
jgi:glycosyltransferase involved in cell wall biosynthesis